MVNGVIKNEEQHIICRVRCAENRDRVRELLLEYVEPARQEPGCLYYDIFQGKDDPDVFYILDGWKDQEAVDAHVKHPNVTRVNAMLHPLLVEGPTLTYGRRISDWPKTEHKGE